VSSLCIPWRFWLTLRALHVQAIRRHSAGSSVTAQDIADAIRQQLHIDIAPELLDLQKKSMVTAGVHQAALRCSTPRRHDDRPSIKFYISDAL